MNIQSKVIILSCYNRLGVSSRYSYYEYAGNFLLFEFIKCYFKRLDVLLSLNKYDLFLIEKELFPFLPFYLMRNDSFNSFGTRSENRFPKKGILELFDKSGFLILNFLIITLSAVLAELKHKI